MWHTTDHRSPNWAVLGYNTSWHTLLLSWHNLSTMRMFTRTGLVIIPLLQCALRVAQGCHSGLKNLYVILAQIALCFVAVQCPISQIHICGICFLSELCTHSYGPTKVILEYVGTQTGITSRPGYPHGHRSQMYKSWALSTIISLMSIKIHSICLPLGLPPGWPVPLLWLICNQ